jgi:hypothetical protein
VGSCGCGDEPLGFIKCEEFLDLDEDLLASQEGFCSMDLVIMETQVVLCEVRTEFLYTFIPSFFQKWN